MVFTIVAFGGSSDELGQGLDLGHQFSCTCCEGYLLLFRASLGNVLLLLVSVGHICATPVGLGRQGSCHSDLVWKGVMGGEI